MKGFLIIICFMMFSIFFIEPVMKELLKNIDEPGKVWECQDTYDYDKLPEKVKVGIWCGFVEK